MGGFSSITGQDTIMNADNASFDGSERAGVLATNGQLWIGTTAVNAGGTHINVGSLTSPNGSITFGFSSPNITAQVTGGSTSVVTLTGNSGVATPVGGNINVVTANTTVKFVGSGSTLTQDFGASNLIIGTDISTAGMTGNVGVGQLALASLIAGADHNTALGRLAGTNITNGDANVCIGQSVLGVLTTGSSNVGINALSNLITGSNNIAIGSSSYAGTNYTSSESNNILLSNLGVTGESNIIRIGTQGSGAGQQNQCYLAGVLNTSSGQVVQITTPGAYPYTTLITDYVILVDTSSARTINLISSPVTGTTYRIKDNVGSAVTNNITITPAAGNIDGSGSFVISSNWGSVDVTYNGVQWNIL